MYSVLISNSLHLSGKPVNPVTFAKKEKLEEALGLALSLHQASTEHHFVLVYDGDAPQPLVSLRLTAATVDNGR